MKRLLKMRCRRFSFSILQFASVANVTYTSVFQRFLDSVNVLNFDVLWIPSAGCVVNVDFHDRLVNRQAPTCSSLSI